MKYSMEMKRDQVRSQPQSGTQRMMHHILQPSHWAKRETHSGQKGRK